MSEHDRNEMVILGVGNDSRGDDGLGWAFLDALEGNRESPSRLIYRYQLQPEDAAEIATAKYAIFVDASKAMLEEGFLWESATPERHPQVNSHWLPPSAVLGLCLEMQETLPDAFVLSIAGYQWELGQGLSPHAARNLEAALSFFREWLRSKGLDR